MLPSVGDSIRIAPGVLSDVSQNAASEDNRWVRIIGEQYIVVESSKLFDAKTEKLDAFKQSSTVTPHKVTLGLPYESVEKQIGIPGFLIRYDLNELSASTGIGPDSLYVKYETSFFTNLGAYINSASGKILCTDKIFDGDCTQNPGNIYLGWNMRSTSGRLVGAGAYIARLKVKIGAVGGDSQKKEVVRTWGVRRVAE